LQAADNNRLLVTDNLTFHGVTKAIELPANLIVKPETAMLESEFPSAARTSG
jgi:hypothetical protein